MGLITRFYGPNRKGSELTIKEMDDNLYYLQSIGVDSISYSSNTLTLTNPTGGTLTTTIESSSEFTGNTSGNCITDLYVTNLYGCSPITLNTNIQYRTSSASGEYSFAEGFQTTAGTQTNERITVLSALTINWFLYPDLGQYIPYVSGTCEQLSVLTEQIEFTSDCLSDNDESTIVNLTLSGGVDDETIYTTNYQSMACDTKFVEGIKFFPERSFEYTGGTGYTTANLEIITVCGRLGVNYCHSEGINTFAVGEGSHAEGSGTTANGKYSHAEGILTTASGLGSHAEGIKTTASGDYSHSGGYGSSTIGVTSFIHSHNSTLSGNYSAILGGQLITGTKDNMVYVPNLNIVYIISANDDLDAGLSGLTTGDIYQTSGLGASPLNVAGILMIKQ
jgi:hypothetical protein